MKINKLEESFTEDELTEIRLKSLKQCEVLYQTNHHARINLVVDLRLIYEANLIREKALRKNTYQFLHQRQIPPIEYARHGVI